VTTPPARPALRAAATALATVSIVAALWWPSPVASPLDGAPLDRPAEALLIGLLVPFLWCVDRGFVRRRAALTIAALLIATKLVAFALVPAQGLCSDFRADPPMATAPLLNLGNISTVTPNATLDVGDAQLRSWDVRARLFAGRRCSAITARSYSERIDFPAWFANLLEFAQTPVPTVVWRAGGFVGAPADGTLTLAFAPGTAVSGSIDGRAFTAPRGEPIALPLAAGVHHLAFTARLGGNDWSFEPTWNGTSAWQQLRITATRPSAAAAAAPALGWLVTALAAGLILLWIGSALVTLSPSIAMTAAVAAMAALMGLVGYNSVALARVAPIALFAAAWIALPQRLQSRTGMLFLVGVPWLALFASLTYRNIGRFAVYTTHDDWFVYQVAGYRIWQQGMWLDGSNPTFYYQPLYRWLSGALHLLFGDSSVGESYWDAGCLLIAGLLSYELVKPSAGERWGRTAAVATLATFAVGAIWYLIGRGLSEITAAGFASLAALTLICGRAQRRSRALLAGLFGALAFYARLNHALFASAIVICAWPLRDQVSTLFSVRRFVASIPWRAVAVYGGCLMVAALLLAFRTWHYTGAFSFTYGTSFGLNDTGLRPSTLLSPEVLARAGEGLWSTMVVNDLPPRLDARAALVFAGSVLSFLAVLGTPGLRCLPLVPVVLTIGALAAAPLAHAHGYPGRVSVHLVPSAVAVCIASMALLFSSRSAGWTR
jgi:hypothetical protein